MTDYIYSIEAKNVNKTYKRKNLEVNALKDFNIKIKKGSIHGLLGPNGAGKSTFINILGGLVKKNTGNINICGIDIDKNQKLSKFKIGIVPQELNIDPFLLLLNYWSYKPDYMVFQKKIERLKKF